ncbi:hypothetical protein SAY86_024366 [Trapa natans]|nr:hypothetical protein SAY86_024366 [Trapa natans]
MKNHVLIVIRLASGVLVQFWCSNTTVPLNVIVTQMGSRCKKALVAESVRESLHSWCKRVKEKSRQDRRRRHLNSHTDRSVCSLDSTIHKGDEEVTVASGTLSRSSSMASVLNRDTVTSIDQVDTADLQGGHCDPEFSLRMEEYLKESLKMSSTAQPLPDQGDDDAIDEESGNGQPEVSNETLWELFMKT